MHYNQCSVILKQSQPTKIFTEGSSKSPLLLNHIISFKYLIVSNNLNAKIPPKQQINI